MNMNDELPIINHLKSYASYTWSRIAFTWQNNRGKLFETTLTQDLIFWLYQMGHYTDLPFELWESQDETANGNDLELAVQTPNGYLLFPCQAKKITPLHKYPKLNHSVNGVQQIYSLLKYSHNNNGMGIYLFYNCCQDRNHTSKHWHGDFDKISSYGCSVVPADFLNDTYLTDIRWKIPTFQELHPKAGVPFHQFIEELITNSAFSNKLWDYYYKDASMSYFSYEDLYNPEKWNNLTPPPRISGIPAEKTLAGTKITQAIEFKPKFRIVINLKKRLATIKILS
jgi:hypothetical protein